MKIKLLIDEDVHFPLASILRKRGFDVVHVQELDRKGKTDKEQLQYAISKGRCIFSFNVRDYVVLHNEFISQNNDHFGIIVSKQAALKVSIKNILKLLNSKSYDEIKNRLEFI